MPADAGMYCLNHWIPARAGMTEGPRPGICRAWQGGCRDVTDFFLSSSSFQRRLESTPAWMQVVERRREQAAEEGAAGSMNKRRC